MTLQVDPNFNAIATFDDVAQARRVTLVDSAGVAAGPNNNAVAVVPSDTVNLAQPTRSIYVGGTGDVKVITVGGQTTIFKAVPVGTTLNVAASRVFATGTTATNIVALY